MDKTIREQVIDDITMATEVTTEIKLPSLSGKETKLSYEEYFMFLAIVMDHIHYVFDQVGYIRLDESKTDLKVA